MKEPVRKDAISDPRLAIASSGSRGTVETKGFWVSAKVSRY